MVIRYAQKKTMMINNTIRILLCLLTVFAILMSLAFSDINSDSNFKVTYATTSPSQSSSATPFLLESLQQAQQGLQSSISNQINRTFTDTIKDINKNIGITNSTIPTISNTTLKNGELYSSSNNTETTKKVKVGDIDIAYKMYGNGPPLLLIMGSGATMDEWDPTFLKKLSSNHTIIVFDKRGFGLTSFGNKNSTISQYANDISGLIDALGIQKPVDILGMSLGGFIAQELTLLHPEKVDRLVIFASGCSGKVAVPPVALAANPIEQIKLIVENMFPDNWKKEHQNYTSYIPLPQVLPSQKSVQSEGQALGNWKGSCDRISKIQNPTLVIVGTDDVILPPINSIEMVQKIPGAWLVQIKDGGHGVMYQYPEKISKIIETFLLATS